MRRTTRILALVVVLLAIPLTATAQDPVIPADEFIYCTVCHGVQLMGNSTLKAPRLSGMETWYVERQLRAFKNGWRGDRDEDVVGSEMQPMAAALSNDQIVEVAEFVEATRSELPEQTVTGNADRGETLYLTCAACHGAAGEGSEALRSPALAGLNDWYLATQLRSFRDGSRGSHVEDTWGVQMRAASRVLPDDAAIADVVAYVASLAP